MYNMAGLKWFLVFLTFMASTSARSDHVSKCCNYGISKVNENFMMEEKFDCSLDNDMMNTIQQKVTFNDEFEKIICKTVFKQCCAGSAKSKFCLAGIGLGQAKLTICTKGDNSVGGEAQRECCSCCQLGEKAAVKAENCSDTVFQDSELCTHAFQKCCKDTRSQLPKPTMRPLAAKRCVDIECDKEKTISCSETKSGPQCNCREGYYLAENNITCLDVNECLNRTICAVGTCVNTEGSHRCVCDQNYKMIDGECILDESKTCKEGYEMKDGVCVDTNECIVDDSSPCPLSMKCLNTEGSYRCIHGCVPSKGFKLVFSQGKEYCVDIDECEIHGNKACNNPFTECLNIVGGYQCKQVRCSNGFDLVDGHCVDIDECQREPDICGKHGNCHNLYGRHSCVCQRGYVSDPITKTCVDEDECKLKKHRCSYQCRNTEGSYTCHCPHGYITQDRECKDIDECKSGNHTCKGSERCFNTYGSFRCIDESCPKPYYIRTGSKYRPFGCRKNCFILTNKSNRAMCLRDKLSFVAVKRVLFDFARTLGFIGRYRTEVDDNNSLEWMRLNNPELKFRYWWTHSEHHYMVNTALVSGNEQNLFGIIHEKGANELFIVNKYKIQGPRQFHIVMVTEVKHKGRAEPVLWKYKYDIYISVSEHKFYLSPNSQ